MVVAGSEKSLRGRWSVSFLNAIQLFMVLIKWTLSRNNPRKDSLTPSGPLLLNSCHLYVIQPWMFDSSVSKARGIGSQVPFPSISESISGPHSDTLYRVGAIKVTQVYPAPTAREEIPTATADGPLTLASHYL
jgi:hypothetical protein